MNILARLAALLLFVFVGGVSATAQSETAASKIPEQFRKIVEIYRGWKPDYGYDIENLATHAQNSFDSIVLDAARNWIFTRSEKTLRTIAIAEAKGLNELFGTIFLGRGVGLAFTKEYGEEVDRRYGVWYACIARQKISDTDHDLIGEKGVLRWVSWQKETSMLKGTDGTCATPYMGLSRYYGVEDLGTDNIMVVGFLHRRFAANANNPKFISAEVVRKLVHEIMDGEDD